MAVSRPQNLEELYGLLNEKEAKILRTYAEKEEVCEKTLCPEVVIISIFHYYLQYDYQGVIEDIDEGDQGDLWDQLPTDTFEKIKSILSGNTINEQVEVVTESKEMSELLHKLIQKMENQAAVQNIKQTINQTELDIESILDEMENKNDCEIYTNLMENNFKESDWTQFCNIIKDKDDKLLHRYHTQTPSNPNIDDIKMKDLKQKLYTMSNVMAANIIIQCINDPHDGFDEFDDISEDVTDKETSTIYQQLEENQSIANIDNIFEEVCQIINKMEPIIEVELKEVEEMKLVDIESIDKERGDKFKLHVDIQDKLGEMLIGMAKVDPKDEDANKAKALVKLRCIFGINTPLQMVELIQRQLIRAFLHNDYDILNQHLTIFEGGIFREAMHNFFADKFVKFKLETINKERWNNWIQGLRTYCSIRFLGYDKYKAIINHHKKIYQHIDNNNNNNNDDDTKDNVSDDGNDGFIYDQVSSDNAGDDFIYYPVLNVQIYLIAFYIELTKYLLNFRSNAYYSVVLFINLPDLKESEPAPAKIIGSITEMIDTVSTKFSHQLQQAQKYHNFEKKMEDHCMAYFMVDFNDEPKDRIKLPQYVTIQEKDIGFKFKEGEYDKNFKNFQLFELMRVKRLFKQKLNDMKLAIAIHKFGKTIKMYLHFMQYIIRIEIQDLYKWFRLLFGSKPWYHQNEINESNWNNEIGQYLQQILQDYKDLNDLPSTENTHKLQHGPEDYQRKIDAVYKKIDNWADFDRDFYDLDALLTQEILEKVEELRQDKFSSAYNNVSLQ